jgi:hypothetical protein
MLAANTLACLFSRNHALAPPLWLGHIGQDQQLSVQSCLSPTEGG